MKVVAFLAAACAALFVFALGASANLPGSSFEGNDGNLVSNGGKDWAGVGANAAPNLVAQQDLQSGGGDNSFGQGTSENDVNVTVVDGSIPNSKADLARFAVAGETGANNHVYLYLAWTRENDSGSVNYDFELNAKAQPDLTTLGAKTLVRTVNDLNISYSFQGNNLTPELSFRVWNGSSWGAENSLEGCSEGLGNSATVADTLGGLGSVNRTQGRFGEAAVDLTCANIVPAGSCEPFSSAYIKSRASQSFQSEIKDFIAPHSISFSNCGSVKIIKRTAPRGIDQVFNFTASGGTISPTSFSLNDKDGATGDSANNTREYTGLAVGQYVFTEGADPTGFAFNNVSCTHSGGNSTQSIAGKVATVNVVGGGSSTCIYVNDQQLGAIKVSKTTKKPGLVGAQPQSGVEFTVNGVKKNTDSSGEACFDGLTFATYAVVETVPDGYQADGATSKNVTVDTNTTCAANPYVGETVSFSNSPLTDVTISVDSKAVGGTDTDVDCDDNSLDFNTTDATGDGTKTSDAVAGSKTIICTIVIDP